MSDVRWQDVFRVALLGTERARLPEPLPPLEGVDGTTLDGLLTGARVGSSPEHGLLAAAGLLWQARRAGRRVGVRPGNAPLALAPPEVVAVLGPRSAEVIDYFTRTESPLLDPWLDAAAARGRVAPYLRLCALLDLGVVDRARRARIFKVLGERGRWVAAQNPAWGWVRAFEEDVIAPDETWRLGLMEERTTVLERLRAVDPARGRALLQTTWSKDGASSRAAFIDALAVGLSEDDEPFLELALDDKRSTVRVAAARLLVRLPASRLVTRMKARLDPLLSLGIDVDAHLPVHLRGKETLFVALPKACDEGMLRDGVLPKVPYYRDGIGERTWWLLQMLRAVPPAHHVRRFRRDSRALVAAASGNEHARHLLDGLYEATVTHGDCDMAVALVDAMLEADSSPASGDVYPALGVSLARLLPPALRSARAQQTLRPPLRNGHPALPLLEGCDFVWSDDLAKAFVRAIRASMRVPVGESEAVRSLLAGAVLRVPASCVDFAKMGWPLTERVPPWTWAHAYDQFLEALRYREEAWAALDDVLPSDDPPSAKNHARSAVFESEAGTDSASMR